MFVYVPRGVQLRAGAAHRGRPPTTTALNWRVLVVLEEGASAEVWEQYLSAGEEDGLFNTVVELVVGPNAHLRFVSGQALNEKSWVFGTQRAVVGARRLARLGGARLRLGERQGADGDAARRRGLVARR